MVPEPAGGTLTAEDVAHHAQDFSVATPTVTYSVQLLHASDRKGSLISFNIDISPFLNRQGWLA
jgi:hypothetical protein